MVDTVAAAHDVLQRHVRAEAFEAFVHAYQASGVDLGPQDLEALAESA